MTPRLRNGALLEWAPRFFSMKLDDADEPRVLLVALRRIAEARGGIAKIAKAAGVERESLYRPLSPKATLGSQPWLLWPRQWD